MAKGTVCPRCERVFNTREALSFHYTKTGPCFEPSPRDFDSSPTGCGWVYSLRPLSRGRGDRRFSDNRITGEIPTAVRSRTGVTPLPVREANRGHGSDG